MKRSNIAILMAAVMAIACGNDPVTNAGYFDDDLDRSVDQSNHDDHSQHNTTTYNIDQSQHNDNSTSITTVIDSVIVIRDTFLVDTYDTIHVTIKDTVRDTLQQTVKVPVYDTITILTADTLLMPVIDTIHQRITVKDTVRDTIVKPITLNAPSITTEQTKNVVRYTSLEELDGISFHFSQAPNSSFSDYKIAISDSNTARTKKGTLLYTVTYYGYNNNRYLIHYRTNGSLWQGIRSNNGCINVVDIHVSTYDISDCGSAELFWATGTAVVCS